MEKYSDKQYECGGVSELFDDDFLPTDNKEEAVQKEVDLTPKKHIPKGFFL
ncbi:hypothetical protein AAAC51_05075 [Priestia megaterium]